MKQTWKRIGSLLLSVCMVFTLLPTVAYAKTNGLDYDAGLGISGEITAFADLDEDIAAKTVEIGTAEYELNLPTELMATVTRMVTVTTGSAITVDVSGNDIGADGSELEETTIAVSGWNCVPVYDGMIAGDYIFTPVLTLTEGLSLADDVNVPQITVTVQEIPTLLSVRSAASNPFQVEGGDTYATLAEAAAAVPNGGMITMLQDVTVAMPSYTQNGISLNEYKNYTIDFGGYTLRSGDNSRIKALLLSIRHGSVILKNGTIKANIDYAHNFYPTAVGTWYSGTVDIFNINISGCVAVAGLSEGKATLWSGTFKSFESYLPALYEENGQVILAKGSTANPKKSLWKDAVTVTVTAVKDTTSPNITASGMRTSETMATLSVNSSERGWVYYLAQDANGNIPNSNQVKSEGIYLGTTDASGVLSEVTITLPAESAQIYVVVEDMAGNISLPVSALPIISAESPEIETQPTTANYIVGDIAKALTVAVADISDGGTLSYQWYKNTTESTEGAIPVGTNAASYTPDISALGTLYYFVVVKNTNNDVNGDKEVSVKSSFVEVNVDKKSLTSLNYTIYVKAGLSQTQIYTLDLKTLLPPGIDPDKVKSYEFGFGFSEGDVSVLQSKEIAGNILTVTIKTNATAGTVEGFEIAFNSDYYNISKANVTLHTTAKTPVKVSGVTVESRVSNGTPISVSGTPVFTNAVTNEVLQGLTPIYTWAEAVSQGDPILPVAPSNPGFYILTVTADGGDSYEIMPLSISFEITESAAVTPEIILDRPHSITVVEGNITENITINATATNGKPISYQWYDGYTPIVGATEKSFQIPTELTVGTYQYWCSVSAEGCNDKAPIFSVVVNPAGSPTPYTITMHLKLNGEPFTNDSTPYQLINSADETQKVKMYGTGATRTTGVPNGKWKVCSVMNDEYKGVTITVDNCPAVETLEIYSGDFRADSEGIATYGTIDVTINEVSYPDRTYFYFSKGESVTFTAIGQGADSYTYVWSGTHNGISITGTGKTYTINSVEGMIDIVCTITGSETGTTPTITVTKHPQSVTVTQGSIKGILTAEAVASNGTTVKYQWSTPIGGAGSDNTMPILGETRNTFTIPIDLTAGTYRYFCSFNTDGNDYVDSNVAIVTVKRPSSGDNGGSTGGSENSNDSSNDSTVPEQPTIVKPDPEKPNLPTTTTTSVKANSKGNVTITDSVLSAVFKKAQNEDKKNGTTQNSIAVEFNITGTASSSNMNVIFPKSVLVTLASNGVKTVTLKQNGMVLTLNLAAIKEIKKANSDVTLSVAKSDVNKLSKKAQRAIGNRPVYSINMNTKNGKAFTDFKNGQLFFSIPYTLATGEKAGNLFGVFVDDKGKVEWLVNSSYDAVNKILRIGTNQLSVYGVGYKADTAATKFTDITNHWAKGDIEFVVARGLFSGIGNGKFSPDQSMTRGMLVTALGKLARADVSSYKTSKFTDVKANTFFLPYIEWANRNDIVKGTGVTTFAPDNSITREQMAVIMANYTKAIGFDIPKVHIEVTFADSASIGAWAKDSVKAMQMAGVLMGKDGNKFDPQGTVTRAEASALFHRFIELTISTDTAEGWTMNDSGKWMYYKNGKAVTGKKDIDGTTYTFDQYGVTADFPKNRK